MGDNERVGRKRRRSVSASDDEDMEESKSRKATSQKGRSLTPSQLKIRSSSKVRAMSQGRREGSVPQPHPTRASPAEHVRLAKKINKRVFKHTVFVNEADRVVNASKPKHLYSGKRSIGKNDRR